MEESISNRVLKMVLAQANKDQNQHYPPSVFEVHYDLVTHWLIDESAKIYPGTQSIIDLIHPYFKRDLVKVVNGIIPFPKEYRHLLGFGIYKKGEKIADECLKISETPSQAELKDIISKTQSKCTDVTTVSIGRWNKLTQHRYKQPTIKNPITCIFDGDGIKISPIVPFVEMRYIIKTTKFKYGYLKNDDDTYYFNPETTQEALWTENAISYLFKGVNTLYSNYIRDPEQVASAKDLRSTGLF